MDRPTVTEAGAWNFIQGEAVTNYYGRHHRILDIDLVVNPARIVVA